MTLHDAATLGEARAWLRERLVAGERCPCCEQTARVYVRPMSHVSARAIIALYRAHRRDFGHMPSILAEQLPDVAHQGGQATLGAHWGLIEEERTQRPDGGRAGYWRVTAAGETWIRGASTIASHARLYSGRCLGHTGTPVSVREVLGSRFDLEALMGPALSDAPEQLTLGVAA